MLAALYKVLSYQGFTSTQPNLGLLSIIFTKMSLVGNYHMVTLIEYRKLLME